MFQDGGPSLFAGFAGFGKTTSGAAPEPEAAASFDFLKKPSNGSENGGKSESAASFDFATPASQTPSLFAFGSANSSQKDSNSATFSFGNGSAKGKIDQNFVFLHKFKRNSMEIGFNCGNFF